jgi:alkyldihydroxyacetonephosphate synthase
MERYGNRGEEHSVSEAFWPWLIKAFAMPALLATPARTASDAALPASRLNQDARAKLALLLGASGLREDDAERARFSGGRGLADLLRRRREAAAVAPDGVLYPRNASDVQGLLALCAELDIAVHAGGVGTDVLRSHAGPVLALDLSGLAHILAQDRLSGLVDVEAGIGGMDLQRQLKAQGLALGTAFENSLGGWIACAETMPAPVQSVTVATPQGALHLDKGLHHLMTGSRGSLGVITSAKLQIRPGPESEDFHAYLFPDFAAGLTLLRQAVRTGIAQHRMLLSNDGATRLERALHRSPWNLRQGLHDAWLALRGFDSDAARLVISFSGSEKQRKLARREIEALAKRLGALALGPATWPAPCPRDVLLDRGVGVERLQFSASWSELPLRYARLRVGLKQAMHANAPVTGARGLVLADVSDVRGDGACLTMTWLFPRKLDDEITQAAAIHQAALAAAGMKAHQGLQREILAAIKHTIDPRDILAPGV